MSQLPRSRGSICRLRTAVGAATLLALALPSASSAGEDITLRTNDVDGAPGQVVRIEIRTYSPRPVGQGQMCVRAGRPGAFLLAAPRGSEAGGSSPRSATQASVLLSGAPFAEFLGGVVYSEEGDVYAEFTMREVNGVPELVVEFDSPSGTINQSDGPLAHLDFRLRDDLPIDDEWEVGVDLSGTEIFGPLGEQLEVRVEPGRLRIREDDGGGDGAGSLRLTQRTFSGREGGQAVVTVERSGGDDGAVSVGYRTVDSSAVAPGDYLAASGELVWGDGDDGVRSFSVQLVADDEVEGSETAALQLLAPTGGAVLDPSLSTAVLSILDGALPPSQELRFTGEPTLRFVEGEGLAAVGIERSGDLSGPVTLSYASQAGSALPGVDYEDSRGQVGWASGEGGVRTISVPLIDDFLFEGTESLVVEVQRRIAGALVRFGEREIEIVDDDAPGGGGCEPTERRLCLQGGRFRVEATWRAADGRGEAATANRLTDSSGTFWFFSPDNVEMLVKVLDGCSVPGQEAYWVFVAATTDQDFTLTVHDTLAGVLQEYRNPLGRLSVPIRDLDTFRTCGSAAVGGD
ncbi:MAG: hypothetical protein DWQ36_11755 [Acidobacteria bacterium]|nr:MAG: hypothetical protein DWQ36_11755 [Acidobacteriota bacterium]